MKQYGNKILLIVLVGILLLINLPFHAILQTASMGGDAEQAVTQLFEKNATATDTDADRATPEDADRATVEDADGVAAKAVDGVAAEDTDRATSEDADAMTTQDIALSYEDQAKQIATISDAISRDVYTPDMKVEIKKEKKSYIFNIDALATVMSFPMLYSEFVVGYRLGRTKAGDTCRDFRILRIVRSCFPYIVETRSWMFRGMENMFRMESICREQQQLYTVMIRQMVIYMQAADC